MRRAALKLLGGVVVGFAMLTLSCASVSVATDYDHTVNFNHYRTFAFLGGHVWVNGMPDDNNTLVKDRIRRGVVAELTSEGLQEVTSNPDIYVTFLAGAHRRTEVESTGPYFSGVGPYFVGGWWGPMYTNWWARQYTEGTLMIDLVDSQSRKLVWRAYAQTELNKPVSDQKMQKVMEKAFKGFPPQTQQH